MYTVTRNTKSNKTGRHLIMIFNNEVFIPLRGAKILCGYSESTSSKVIISKISSKNIKVMVTFAKKGGPIENLYITVEGFEELVNNLTQKDKVQNGKNALEMIYDVQKNKMDYNVEEYDEPVAAKSIEYPEENLQQGSYEKAQTVSEIVKIVGPYSNETRYKWIALYDELDKCLDVSIRTSWEKYKYKTGRNVTILWYIKEETNILPILYSLAKDMFS